MNKQSPYELLVALDQSCRQQAAGLPSQKETIEDWGGIGFQVGRKYYVAPMNEVAEVLHEPRYTLLPGVKSWVRGVANVRGRLLPVVDLCEFLGEESLVDPNVRRILVVEHQDVFAGLIVDAVLGMQYFALDSFSEQLSGEQNTMSTFAHGVFQREQPWLVFSLHALARDANFMDVVA